LATVGGVCGDRNGVRREIRDFLSGLALRYPGVADSVLAALANVNPYTLLDRALSKAGGAAPVPQDPDGLAPAPSLRQDGHAPLDCSDRPWAD
jgi:hypothetical protein